MTHEEWMATLAPVISALVLGLTAIIGAVLTGVTGRLKAYLDARGQQAASAVLADASVRLQAAMQNGAGNIALAVRNGTLDITDQAKVQAMAVEQARGIVRKLPSVIDALQPVENAIIQGVTGKVTSALAAPATAPAVTP